MAACPCEGSTRASAASTWCADGDLRVLEDNVRTPSGYAYLRAARDVLDERLPDAATLIDAHSVGDIVELLGDALRAGARRRRRPAGGAPHPRQATARSGSTR